MTVSEMRFNETVPAYLKRIADATERIAAERERANKLSAIQILMKLRYGNGCFTVHEQLHYRAMLRQAMGVDDINFPPEDGKEGAE